MWVDRIVRGLVTLALVGASLYLLIIEQEVPTWLAAATGGAMGQYLPTPGRMR